MPETLTPVPDAATNAVSEWLRPYPLALPASIHAAAYLAAARHNDNPDAPIVANLTPGNGYAYTTVLVPIPEDPTARGNLLVALPDHHVCLLLNDHGGDYHVPGYVAEKTRLHGHDSAVIAAFLTLFSHMAHRPNP